MQVYIASSWKNQHAVEMLTERLRDKGYKVMSFIDEAVKNHDRKKLNFDVDEWIISTDGIKKFCYDTEAATKSDIVIYIGPSGTDAWAEVGAAWGSGVPILGLYAKGEPSGLMRHMIRWFTDYRILIDYIESELNNKTA